MAVSERDRVVAVHGAIEDEIAEAVSEECSAAGAEVVSLRIEDFVPRPAATLPSELAEAVRAARPTVSFYMAQPLVGELQAFRRPLVRLLLEEIRTRHGHMLDISDDLMVQGMAADYDEVYRLTMKVHSIARSASRIEVYSPLGTELVATFSPTLRWVPCHGRYHEQGQWGNLPEGETFTAPLSVDGLLVGETMGDSFSPRYGLFEEPVRLRVRSGMVIAADMPGHPAIEAEIRDYLGQHPMSSRAGEFAIGTNTFLDRIIGNFTQDEKFPGVHVAFGDPYGPETGADWSAPSHVDVLTTRTTVIVDGRTIMEEGRFLV